MQEGGKQWVVNVETALACFMVIGAVASAAVANDLPSWQRALALLTGSVVGFFGGVLALRFAGKRPTSEVQDATA